MNKDQPSPIILVSTGRTGTVFFSKFFGTYGENLESHHSTSFTRSINVLSNMYRARFLPRSVLASIWKFLKYNRINNCQSRYVECNPYYYNIIEIIRDYFPETKVLFVVRSPKSYVLSHIKWERGRWKSSIANKLIPFWQPVPYLEHLKGLTNNFHQRVEFYSRVWGRKNSDIMKSIDGSENAFILKFEDVFDPDRGDGVLRDVMQWLDVPQKKDLEGAVSKKVNASKASDDFMWDDHCDRTVQKYCGELMKELGYEE